MPLSIGRPVAKGENNNRAYNEFSACGLHSPERRLEVDETGCCCRHRPGL